MTRIIIDTDPGVDDGMAIQLALHSGEFDILGLTTVFGNVDVDKTTANALRFVSLANRRTIPVAKGAANPFMRDFNGGVPFIHGHDGQGNTWQPESDLLPAAMPAEDFIISQLVQFPHEVTIAALGPLTNLAAALRKNPAIQHLVKEIVIMGGNAFCPGNATPAAEANIFSDPEAADIVFGAAWPVTMVGLDVTHKIFLHKDVLHELSQVDTPLNRQVAASYVFYQDFFIRTNKIAGSYVHDASVFAYLLNKDLFKTVQHPVRVETAACISLGKTWPSAGESDHELSVSLKPWSNRPRINICVDVDGKAVIDLIVSRLIRQQ